jgi:hypothetical protein
MMKKLQLALLVMLAAITTASAQYQRRVLVEEFTNAFLPALRLRRTRDSTLNPFWVRTHMVTPVKYQTNWPGVDPFNAQNPTDVAYPCIILRCNGRTQRFR